MKITSVEFIKSAYSQKDFVKEILPQVAFSGRSNVGKSSLINKLLGRKNVAKVSKTPGKTQLINYFKINDNFFLIDLPGYGYAKVSAKKRNHWGDFVTSYYLEEKNLRFVVQLIDSRLEPQESDVEMVEWFKQNEIDFILVATKIDKLSQSERELNLRKIREVFETEKIIPVSSKTGFGIGKLLENFHFKRNFE
ncbi:YihA family ribosome biogenesis GTP-binding protein [bacterium]|nr:YihA family ribosome biogenesis GTP-binding protein [bacterium]